MTTTIPQTLPPDVALQQESPSASQHKKKQPKHKPSKSAKPAGQVAPRSGAGSEPSPQEINMLVALFNQKRYAEMETLAREMTVRFPLYGFGWKAAGTALLQQGCNEEALVPLQKAAELSQGDAQPYNNMGNTLVKLGRLPEAEASYRNALEINPNFFEAHNNLGNTLLKLDRMPEAEASYRRAVEINPNFAEAHNNLGNTLLKLGRLDEAETNYRRALEIKPDFAEAHNNLGNTLLKLGRLSEAEASYRRALKLKPDYSEAHGNLGNALWNQGRTSEAEASYQRALEIKPDYADAHIDLGIILRERGLHRESVYHLQQAFAERVGWHHDGDKDLSSGLVYAYIELTNKCNFHCDFCPSDSQQRAKSFMSMGLIQQICDEFAKKNLVKILHLHLMGEPTLHPDLVEVLAYASSKNIKTELVTNGSTLNAKTIPKILDALYGVFAVSLQTPTRETFKHRGKAGLGWDRYIGNIRLLIREYLKRIALKQTCRCTLELRVMVTKDSKLPANIIESPDDIRDVMHEWRNFVAGIEAEFGLTPYDRKEPSSETLTQTTQAEVKYPLQQGLSLSFWQGFTFANSMLGSAYSLENKKTATFCSRPFIDVAVLSNGDVTLCCLDYDGKLAVGNVKDNTIEAILNGKPTMDLRAAMLGRHPLPPFCQQCQAEPVLQSPSNQETLPSAPNLDCV